MNELQIIEHQNQRVLLTSQLAESYGTTNQIITNNFNRNKERYKEGKHYIALEGNEKKMFINLNQIELGSLVKAKTIYLWTERGAFLHAKSLNTDKAWEVYDSLVEHYFRSKKFEIQLDSYMIEDPVKRAERWIEEEKERQALRLENKSLNKEVLYKEDVIIGLVDDIDLTEKRRRITEIIRHSHDNYSDRYNKLYKEFEMKYHLDLNRRMNSQEVKNIVPKIKNKMDYIDRCMNKIPELYEICCKLFENDVKELVNEMYSANSNKY